MLADRVLSASIFSIVHEGKELGIDCRSLGNGMTCPLLYQIVQLL